MVVRVRLNYRQRAVVVITSVAKLQLIRFAISKKTFTTERKKKKKHGIFKGEEKILMAYASET